FTALRNGRNKSQGGINCLVGQILGNPEPRKERRSSKIQRRFCQSLRKRRVLEVYWTEHDVSRDRDSTFGQTFALNFLTLRMVDFNNAKPGAPTRLAVRECIHTCTEQHVLFDTIDDGFSERVLHVASPQDESGTEPNWRAGA